MPFLSSHNTLSFFRFQYLDSQFLTFNIIQFCEVFITVPLIQFMATKGSVGNLVEMANENLDDLVLEDPTVEDKEKRVRKLTQKAQEKYESDLAKYTNKIDNAWTYIEHISLRIETLKDIKSFRQLKDDLNIFAKKYFDFSDEFFKFFYREKILLQEIRKKACDVVENLKTQIRGARMEIIESKSATNSRLSAMSSSAASAT
ncbi:hypothetical protein KUTeg_022134 [Tegillarca granosa]|uniref:Uncharacterized protein n=1 Tax=Tegillarca granosa TaxID=220873 RepID=A0ABQ9EAX3_TEGGR|nr:hypothetical protein KUTeg_022134 [Tegillarca granosa]